MGLDMYLDGHIYNKNWDYMKDEEKHDISLTKGGATVTLIGVPKYVITELLYWRKANAIHHWFVDNVQNGNDDCDEYYVSKDMLSKLLSTIEAVLADHSKAATILPTQRGFFFGDTEYDEYYYQELEYTKDKLSAILAQVTDNIEIYYRSSW